MILQKSNKEIIFYREEGDKKLSFFIDGEPHLTEYILDNVKTKRVYQKHIKYVVKAIDGMVCKLMEAIEELKEGLWNDKRETLVYVNENIISAETERKHGELHLTDVIAESPEGIYEGLSDYIFKLLEKEVERIRERESNYE